MGLVRTTIMRGVPTADWPKDNSCCLSLGTTTLLCYGLWYVHTVSVVRGNLTHTNHASFSFSLFSSLS